MLHEEILQPESQRFFDQLKQSHELEGLTLIGGTALALQTGHRLSLDFDFAWFEEYLPGKRIDQFISRMKKEAHDAHLVTEPGAISRFRINQGGNLLDYVRDYVINGVKVTFFTHAKNEQQQEFYQQVDKISLNASSFTLLGMEGLMAAKTLVLADRVRSRDIYDLYVLMKDHDFSIDQAFEYVKALGTVDDPEYYKSVLRGEILLDKEDEGLQAVDVDISMSTVYSFFDDQINQYEIQQAKGFF